MNRFTSRFNTINEKTITKEEKVFIKRRRSKISQELAAVNFGVPLKTYRKWESTDGGASTPAIVLGDIHNFEICVLHRRRSGVMLKDLAKELNVSRYHVIKMESGRANPKQLIDYWDQRA